VIKESMPLFGRTHSLSRPDARLDLPLMILLPAELFERGLSAVTHKIDELIPGISLAILRAAGVVVPVDDLRRPKPRLTDVDHEEQLRLVGQVVEGHAAALAFFPNFSSSRSEASPLVISGRTGTRNFVSSSICFSVAGADRQAVPKIRSFAAFSTAAFAP